MLSVGEHVLDDVDDRTRKMATGFSGGVGRTHRYLCGAFTAGIMVISALYGRTSLAEDEIQCMRMIENYRDRFVQRLGSVYCYKLREERYGSHNQEPCSVLVTRAVNILMGILGG
jgi:C_GCAxxG_C_C family probable redox protein